MEKEVIVGQALTAQASDAFHASIVCVSMNRACDHRTALGRLTPLIPAAVGRVGRGVPVA